MSHPYFFRGALFVAVMPGFFGVNALFRPEAALKGAEFPVPTDPAGRKLSRSLMRLYGIRNIAVSYILALVWATGDERLTALGLLGGLAMCIVDGFVSRSQIGGGEWNHWSIAPVIGGVVAGLLGWFD